MIWQMILIEQQKVTRRTLFWVELALTGALVLLMFGVLFGVRQTINSEMVANSDNIRVEGVEDPAEMDSLLTWPNGIINTLGAVGSLGSLLLIVLVGATTAQEYGWRGFGLWLSRGVPRPTVLLAKVVLVVTTALLVAGLAAAIGTLVTAGFSQYLLGEIPFHAVNWGAVAGGVFVAAYGMLPYAALALFLAVLSRSPVVTIGVGVAFATLGESILMQVLPLLGGFWADVAQFLPAGLAATLHTLNRHVAAGIDTAGSSGLAVETAVLAVALYLLVLGSGALLIFQRQDLGS